MQNSIIFKWLYEKMTMNNQIKLAKAKYNITDVHSIPKLKLIVLSDNLYFQLMQLVKIATNIL